MCSNLGVHRAPKLLGNVYSSQIVAKLLVKNSSLTTSIIKSVIMKLCDSALINEKRQLK